MENTHRVAVTFNCVAYLGIFFFSETSNVEYRKVGENYAGRVRNVEGEETSTRTASSTTVWIDVPGEKPKSALDDMLEGVAPLYDWYMPTYRAVDVPKVREFLEEICAVCKKYELSISHEDVHGGFEIQEYDEYNIEWLKEAHIEGKK